MSWNPNAEQYTPSDRFMPNLAQTRNFDRYLPLEVFTQMVKEAKPPFYDDGNSHSLGYPLDYVHWIFYASIGLQAPRYAGLHRDEARLRIEAFLLAYYNLWSAEDENKLQLAFYRYEQLVHLDLKETCLRAIFYMLIHDFPRNFSFMQMHSVKHLPSSKLRNDSGRNDTIAYYFLHPDLTFTWQPTVNEYCDNRPLLLFLQENKLFHYETIYPYKDVIYERHTSYWLKGYKYHYVLEGTLQNRKLIDTVVAEHVDRTISIMKPSFEAFIRELRSRFFYDDNLNGNTNRELNHVKDEPQFQFADPAWKPQLDRLSKIEAALGNDFNRFYTDPLVQKHLPQLLNNPNLAPFLIRKALKKWQAVGSPAHVSPFAELIKSLLG